MQETVKGLNYVCISVSIYVTIQISWLLSKDEPQKTQ